MNKVILLVLALVGLSLGIAIVNNQAAALLQIPTIGFPWSIVALAGGAIVGYVVMRRVLFGAIGAVITYALTFGFIWVIGTAVAAVSCAVGAPCGVGV